MPEWSVKYRTHETAHKFPQTCQDVPTYGAMTVTRGWKSDEDRGPVGAWFVRAIGERSIEQVAKDMADRGHAHRPDYYRGIMSGSKKPGRALLAALAEYLGSSPDIQGATDVAAVVGAIYQLIEEMRETRRSQAEWMAGVQDVLVEQRAARASAQPKGARASATPAGARR
jgi:hypothetical protein